MRYKYESGMCTHPYYVHYDRIVYILLKYIKRLHSFLPRLVLDAYIASIIRDARLLHISGLICLFVLCSHGLLKLERSPTHQVWS